MRLLAGIIDLLQFLLLVVLAAFQFMTPVGGGISGAAAGAYFCYNATSGAVSAVLEGLKCAVGGGLVGAGLSAFALPLGIAVDIAISGTFGVLLILLLWVSGRFSLMAVMIGFTGEMLPGINGFVPAWSLLVHRCIHQYKTAQKQGVSTSRTSFSILGTAAKLVPALGGGTAAALVRAAPTIASVQAQAKSLPDRIATLPTKNFDGIRRPAPISHEAIA